MPARLGRRRNEQEERDLLVRQGALTALAKHPSWPTLEEVMNERIRVYEKEIVSKVFYGAGLDPERQAFIRGFVKGMAYTLAVPTGAEASLEKYLRQEGKTREEIQSGRS